MNALLQWGGHPVVYRLGWTLLHFLWQGAVIAGLFGMVHICQRRRSSHARYWTGCLALLLMLAAPLITFIALGAERTAPLALVSSGARSNPASPLLRDVHEQPDHVLVSPVPNPNRNLNPNPHPSPFAPALHSETIIPGFVLAWLLGVSALSIRLSFSSLQVARLKRRGNEALDTAWMERLDRLKAALQVSRPVRLVKSVLVEVPALVGWLRPVILLPAATLTGLTPAQLESILAHELAHVRRHDYLVNLLQNALETLLFYHPAVWWVSSCVRAEREICCDEIAIKACGDRLIYAQALTALEQLRAGRSSLALGADGSSLLERIRRLSGAPGGGSVPGRRRAGGALVAALVAIVFVSLLHHPSSNAKAQATPPVKANKTNVEMNFVPNLPAALNGTVFLPNGQPAAGAELVLQVTNDLLYFDVAKGFLTENHMTNRPEDGARPMSAFAIADAGGHFHLPPMENVAALLAIHAQGFTWMTPSELKGDLEVRLEPLGNVEGTFRFGDRPGTNEIISLGPSEPRLHFFSELLETKTDDAGHFVFTNLPALHVILIHMSRMDPPEINPVKSSANVVMPGSVNGFTVIVASRGGALSSEKAKVLVKGGATTEVEFGGTGRPVVGKASKAGMAFDWSQAHVQLNQQALPKPEFQEYLARIADDGAFRMENVGAGNYDLVIRVCPDDGKSKVLHLADSFSVLTRNVVVPEMAGGRSLEALDLGSLEIQHPQAERKIKLGEQAPTITATNFVQGFGGGPINPADDPGKYVLLDLCGNYFDSDLPFLQATHDAFAADSRLVMKSVTLGYILEDEFHTGLTSETEPWSHAYTGPIQMADWAEAYGLLDQSRMIRQIVLIGPEGKILAKDLHGDGIKAAVARVLDPGNTNAGEKPPAATNQTNEIPQPVNSSKPAANPSGISLEIRCTNEVLKVGDEIPIQFILSNHGTKDYWYTNHMPNQRGGDEFKLAVKTSSGGSVPVLRPHSVSDRVIYSAQVLHPGDSVCIIVPLNRWALIEQPGRYEITGTYLGDPYPARPFGSTAFPISPTPNLADPRSIRAFAPVSANPVSIAVLPRTKEEMDDYIKGLTNQVAARLALAADQPAALFYFLNAPDREVLVDLLWKLICTRTAKVVPSLLTTMSEGDGVTAREIEALWNCVPNTEETRQAIVQAAVGNGLNQNLEQLLLDDDEFDHMDLRPLIERALAAGHPAEWQAGADLAAHCYYSDAFTARLTAIARDTNAPVNTRSEAMRALAVNRTEAGRKAFQTLINDPELEAGGPLIWPFGFDSKKLLLAPTRELLPTVEFDAAKDFTPLIERLLASTKPADIIRGVSLARWSGDEALTAKLAALATNPGATDRDDAIGALASLNRTDEGVKTLKTLLNDPDPEVWAPLAFAILQGCDSERQARRGRHLQREDFEAREVRPLMERLLASSKPFDQNRGLQLAEMFGDDALTVKLVALAVDSRFAYRASAIRALALNRTDEGVKTLKTLLNDPDPEISTMTEQAIRIACLWRGAARGRPLRADDFDAKFQQPEATPAK